MEHKIYEHSSFWHTRKAFQKAFTQTASGVSECVSEILNSRNNKNSLPFNHSRVDNNSREFSRKVSQTGEISRKSLSEDEASREFSRDDLRNEEISRKGEPMNSRDEEISRKNKKARKNSRKISCDDKNSRKGLRAEENSRKDETMNSRGEKISRKSLCEGEDSREFSRKDLCAEEISRKGEPMNSRDEEISRKNKKARKNSRKISREDENSRKISREDENSRKNSRKGLRGDKNSRKMGRAGEKIRESEFDDLKEMIFKNLTSTEFFDEETLARYAFLIREIFVDQSKERARWLELVRRRVRCIQRSKYYEAETRRRRELADLRRKQGRRTTHSAPPTVAQIRDAWERRKESKANIIHLGSLLLDLECSISRAFHFDDFGRIVARTGGILNWLRENMDDLVPHYKSLMSYRALAKKVRQVANLRDPQTADDALALEPRPPCIREIFAHASNAFSNILAVLNFYLREDFAWCTPDGVHAQARARTCDSSVLKKEKRE